LIPSTGRKKLVKKIIKEDKEETYTDVMKWVYIIDLFLLSNFFEGFSYISKNLFIFNHIMDFEVCNFMIHILGITYSSDKN
jgi:hypothetical protein